MRRLLLLTVFFLLLSPLFGVSVAETQALKLAQATFPDYRDYQVSDSISKWVLIQLVAQKNWFEEMCLVDVEAKRIRKLSIDEQSVLSARFVKMGFPAETMVEIAGKTHMGNGNLYLFDTGGNVLLSTLFVDFHHEGYSLADVQAKNPRLAEKLPVDGEYSQLFRNGHLSVDYKYKPALQEIQIFGVVDYVQDSDDYRSDRTVDSENLAVVFRFDKNLRKFERLDDAHWFADGKWN